MYLMYSMVQRFARAGVDIPVNDAGHGTMSVSGMMPRNRYKERFMWSSVVTITMREILSRSTMCLIANAF